MREQQEGKGMAKKKKPKCRAFEVDHDIINVCPICDYETDKASSTTNGAPRPDDFSVCMNCACILRFDANLKLRVMKPSDLDELRSEPQAWAECMRLVRAIRTMHAQSGPANGQNEQHPRPRWGSNSVWASREVVGMSKQTVVGPTPWTLDPSDSQQIIDARGDAVGTITSPILAAWVVQCVNDADPSSKATFSQMSEERLSMFAAHHQKTPEQVWKEVAPGIAVNTVLVDAFKSMAQGQTLTKAEAAHVLKVAGPSLSTDLHQKLTAIVNGAVAICPACAGTQWGPYPDPKVLDEVVCSNCGLVVKK
jgi:hypothetical protein